MTKKKKPRATSKEYIVWYYFKGERRCIPVKAKSAQQAEDIFIATHGRDNYTVYANVTED